MAPNINYLDPYDLNETIKQFKQKSSFLKDTFFKRKIISQSNTLAYQKLTVTDGLARIVRQGSPAVPVGKSSRSAKTIQLLTTNEKMTFGVKEFQDMKMLGSLMITDKISEYDMWMKSNTEELMARKLLRQEQLCAAALSGKISISNNDIDQEIDYEFVATTHTETLDSTHKWNATTGDPYEDIRRIQTKISKRTGMKADVLVFGEQATQDFITNTLVLSQLNNLNYNVGKITPSDSSNYVSGGQLIATLPDGTKCYMYNQVYTNDSGAETAMIDTNSVFFGCSQAEAYTGYCDGAIYRFNDTGNTIKTYIGQLADMRINDAKTEVVYSLESIGAPVIKSPDVFFKLTVHA